MAEAQVTAQALLDGIVSISAEAIICIDEEQRITLFNHGAEKTFGYAAEEMLGRSLDQLIPERFRLAHAGHIQSFARSGIEARLMGERRQIFALAKDGREFPAEASISQFVTGGRRTFTVVLRDISVRKEFERALVSAKEELEARVASRTAELMAAIDAIPDGFVLMDKHRRIRLVNTAMCDLFGYDRTELQGRFASELPARVDDDRTISRAWETCWETPGPKRPVTVTYRRKSGSLFQAMAFGNVVLDSNSTVVGRIMLVRDITDEMSRQRALQQAQKMEAVGQLAGGIAHDFNNLLTVVVGNLELLEMRLETEAQRRLLVPVQEAAARGANLTDRLLTFSRKQSLEPELVKINALVMRTSDLLRRTIGEHIALTTALAPDIMDVATDPGQIESALMNLAINARDAMPQGGRLLIEARNVTVDRDMIEQGLDLTPGAYVALSVADTGSGIPPEIRDRVFEPFFTTKDKGRGTGLGLAMVYGFVKQSGGHVTIESEVDRGTTVTLYLPGLGADEAIVADDRAEPASSAPTGGVVLLVEDDPEVRKLNTLRLRQLGYEVIEARTGADALNLVAGGLRPRLIFSDAIMPGGVSGPQLYERAKAIMPDLKFLLTTGYSDEMLDPDRTEAHPFKILRKPYKLAELATALRDALK